MWLEDADGFADFFRGYLPYYLLIALPIFIIISPTNPVAASHEFTVHRMQHYDLHGAAHGCRSASVNLEARSLVGWSTSRHCIVTRLQDITIDHFTEIRAKAGALLIALPEDLSALTVDDKQHLMLLEEVMLAQEITIPVYFAKYTPELNLIIEDISKNSATDDKTASATESIINSVSANGYQIVINAATAAPKQDIKVSTIQGKITGTGADGKVPTIAIVAHYDSFGIAPELSFGADSNGSGVSILLEIAKLFSQLYSNMKTVGKYNLIFLLTGAGKINYQGSKKWLEDQLDSLEGSIIQDASFVLCLDTLAMSESIYMHVSKPPKENSPAALFFKELKSVADKYPSVIIDGVHKKINLADETLAWEHERFSIRRLPAFTLSSLKSHKDSFRRTIIDVKDSLNMNYLLQNTKIIVEALGRFVYNYTQGDLFTGKMKVERESLKSSINMMASQPRSVQLLLDKQNTFINTLKMSLGKHVKDIKVTYLTPDKRDPEFMFYEVSGATVNVYNVKPAVFDLILTFAILIYLAGVYFFIQLFPKIYDITCKLTPQKKKVN